MLYTLDGRAIRGRRGVHFEVADISPDRATVFTNEVRANGDVLPGPAVTASEWLRHTEAPWVRCSGSGGRPTKVQSNKDNWYYGAGICPACGNGIDIRRTDHRVFEHKRPLGGVIVGGTITLV
jgi:hypothetical protein